MGEKKVATGTGTPRAVIWDIAQRSGVSIATVSRALNNRPDVAEATREKVMNAVRELGYVSNRYERALVSSQISYIGFTVPRVEDFTPILQGVSDAVDEHDANLVLCTTSYEHDREVSLLARLQAGGVEGAILVAPSESTEELLELHKRGYPFVVICPRTPLSDDIPVVTATNMHGGRAAAEHLVALGHRRIGVITEPAGWYTTVDRLAGYHSVLFGAGIQNHAELLFEAEPTREGGYQAARALLALATPPTAIFAFNDMMAVGVLRAARECGLRVPEDLSVIGFNDDPCASDVMPTLTTIRLSAYELGRVGVDVLYRLIDGEPLAVTRIELSTRLIIRESTAPRP